MTFVTIPLNELPAIIRESVRLVLEANGYHVVRRGLAVGLLPVDLERLLHEIGKNAAQSVAHSEAAIQTEGSA